MRVTRTLMRETRTFDSRNKGPYLARQEGCLARQGVWSRKARGLVSRGKGTCLARQGDLSREARGLVSQGKRHISPCEGACLAMQRGLSREAGGWCRESMSWLRETRGQAREATNRSRTSTLVRSMAAHDAIAAVINQSAQTPRAAVRPPESLQDNCRFAITARRQSPPAKGRPLPRTHAATVPQGRARAGLRPFRGRRRGRSAFRCRPG
jgi:hypothetical protein